MTAVAGMPRGAERRLFIRHATTGDEVPVVLWARPHPHRQPVRNLSRTGLALVLDYAVEPGTALRLALHNRSGNF